MAEFQQSVADSMNEYSIIHCQHSTYSLQYAAAAAAAAATTTTTSATTTITTFDICSHFRV